MEHGCETNRVFYSSKITVRTIVVLGLVLGGVVDAQAQVPQDPYPSFGGVFLAQRPETQGPALQGPVLQGAAKQEPIMQGPLLQGLAMESPAIQAPLVQGPGMVEQSQDVQVFQFPSAQPDSDTRYSAQTPHAYGPAQPSHQPSASVDLFQRSQQLERIAQDADRHTQKAFELASRGAHYSAQAELVRALRLIAQGLDSDRQCRAYSQALRAGLKALEEVDDFIPTGSQLESDLPLREIIARHQTTLFKDRLITPDHATLNEDRLTTPNQMTVSEDRPGLSSDFSPNVTPPLPTPMEAVGAYLRYAQEQLSIAAGGEVAGSMALHGLGKLYAAREGTELNISVSQAIVCFRAASTVCPQNYLAQNDLGVLLARAGRTVDACEVLEKSVLARPHPTTMANLTVVYQALGRKDLVEKTRKYLAAYQKAGAFPSKDIPAVDWVSPEKFSKTYAQTPDARQLPPVRRPSDIKAKQPEAKQADRSWPWSWTKR